MTNMPPPAPAKTRDRVLSDHELAALWRAATPAPASGNVISLDAYFGRVVKLLIATAARRDEVLRMDFSELDWLSATWTIPASRSKNGLVHIVPLNSLATAELAALGAATRKRGLVFTTTGKTPMSGVSKFKARLDKAVFAQLHDDDPDATVSPWRLHDIRRTVATGLQRLGIRFEVTEAVLNHVSGSKGGVAGVYQRHDWAEEKKAALEAWGRHVEVLVYGEPRSANMVTLRA